MSRYEIKGINSLIPEISGCPCFSVSRLFRSYRMLCGTILSSNVRYWPILCYTEVSSQLSSFVFKQSFQELPQNSQLEKTTPIWNKDHPSSDIMVTFPFVSLLSSRRKWPRGLTDTFVLFVALICVCGEARSGSTFVSAVSNNYLSPGRRTRRRRRPATFPAVLSAGRRSPPLLAEEDLWRTGSVCPQLRRPPSCHSRGSAKAPLSPDSIFFFSFFVGLFLFSFLAVDQCLIVFAYCF